jgi:hypothetical protein
MFAVRLITARRKGSAGTSSAATAETAGSRSDPVVREVAAARTQPATGHLTRPSGCPWRPVDTPGAWRARLPRLNRQRGSGAVDCPRQRHPTMPHRPGRVPQAASPPAANSPDPDGEATEREVTAVPSVAGEDPAQPVVRFNRASFPASPVLPHCPDRAEDPAQRPQPAGSAMAGAAGRWPGPSRARRPRPPASPENPIGAGIGSSCRVRVTRPSRSARHRRSTS